MTLPARFKDLLAQRSGVAMPGCYDALSARQVEMQGFAAACLSGFSVSAVMGYGDTGLMDLKSMAARTAEVAQAIQIPLLVDGDDGYGGTDRTAECVRTLEAAGAAGLHIDDQVLPRAPGARKELVPLEVIEEKITLACSARHDRDFSVVGRTDAMATGDFDEALRRARALERSGADAVMVMYLTEVDQVRAAADLLGVPLLLAVTETARKSFSARELAGLGHAAVMYPVTTLLVGLAAQARALSHLALNGDTQALEPLMLPIDQVRALPTRSDGRGVDGQDHRDKKHLARSEHDR